MPRIRTIKPEFFLHEELFDAETDSGLPLRLAFAGLWCHADREGRFKWRPRALKAGILPYDDCDFELVLGTLAERGFVQQYEVEGERCGSIPGFTKHQVVNNRERQSELPPPPVRASSTRGARVPDASGTRDRQAQAGVMDPDQALAYPGRPGSPSTGTEAVRSQESDSSTRGPRVLHASGTRGQSRRAEGKGKEGNSPLTPRKRGDPLLRRYRRGGSPPDNHASWSAYFGALALGWNCSGEEAEARWCREREVAEVA